MTEQNLTEHVVLSQLNELPVLRIRNQRASATIAVQGAHIIEYAPVDATNMLFTSAAEAFNTGKAIRGGIPICWPWFGPSKTEGAPAHGLVRTVPWQYDIVSDSTERTEIRFWIETDGTHPAFAQRARAELLVSIGSSLVVSLTTTNLDEKPMLISQALHSYFRCQDVEDVRLHGLHGAVVFDSVSRENGYVPHDFRFNREIDWIVRDQGKPIAFSGLGQKPVRLTRLGSGSVVIWNPWVEKSKTLSQFLPEEYRQMFCVETANVSEDSRLIKPGQNHVLLMELTAMEAHEDG